MGMGTRPQDIAGQELREQMMIFIEGFVEDHGYPPTARELSNHFDRNTEGMRKHLHKLQEEGRLRLGPGPRTMVIVK